MKNSRECVEKTDATQPTLADVLDLEFPDWSGQDDRLPPMPPAEAFRLVEECAGLYAPKHGEAERRLAAKCQVEFVL
jgi:hypothetical protein